MCSWPDWLRCLSPDVSTCVTGNRPGRSDWPDQELDRQVTLAWSKALAIGPDPAGNLLEVIWVELDLGVELVIHAMPLRPRFYDLLPDPGETR